MKEGKHLSDILKDLGYDARTRVTRNVENVQAVGQGDREQLEGNGKNRGTEPCSGSSPARGRPAEPPREDSHG